MEHPDPAKLRILHYPDGRLREHAAQLPEAESNRGKEIRSFLQEMTERMAELMREAKGIGLAATQVGWPFRFIVMNPTPETPSVETFVNPVIVSKRGKLFEEEGCLSVPGVFARVRRAEIVVVRAMLPSGEPFEAEATGLLARAWQHEIDHLEGTLFVDRVNPAGRIVIEPKLEEMEKEYKAEQPKSREEK